MLTDDGKHLYVSWDEYHMLTERLALKVHNSGWQFDQILCLARGGMRPGDVLSRVFDKPLAIMSTSSYRAEAGTIQGRLDMAKYITMPKGELAGRVLLVDFIYTGCPTYCVALGSVYARLQERLAPEIAAGTVRLLSVSFDPGRDGPAELAAYRARFSRDAAGWDLARPARAEELARSLAAFGVVVIPDGMGGYAHNAAVHVVGPDRRLLLQAPVFPATGPIDAALERMAADAATYPVAAWKTYTHAPDQYRLDDERGAQPRGPAEHQQRGQLGEPADGARAAGHPQQVPVRLHAALGALRGPGYRRRVARRGHPRQPERLLARGVGGRGHRRRRQPQELRGARSAEAVLRHRP